MSDPRERDDIFRNRIADALRWSDENSDAAIERELAEIEAAPPGAAPLRDDEVSRILAKTTAMCTEPVPSPPGERVPEGWERGTSKVASTHQPSTPPPLQRLHLPPTPCTETQK